MVLGEPDAVSTALIDVQFIRHVGATQRRRDEQAVLDRDAGIVRRVEEKSGRRSARHLAIARQSVDQFRCRVLSGRLRRDPACPLGGCMVITG